MCGIAGIWGSGNVERMIEAIQHRGPDGCGFFKNQKAQLGVSRLAILDITHGNQPMTNEQNNLTIVHNGEVYNYEELRDTLVKKGYRFRTGTDTEVVLHSFAEWGADCLQRFNGMFAFAIWNHAEQKLFLARDRVGVKPLYWANVQNRFLFASEVKGILPEFPSAPELTASFFNFECPLLEKTLFQNIQSLLPGHFLIYDGKKVDIHCYWQIPENLNAQAISDEDAVQELSSLIHDSIRLRMKSDVPVGVFLSGGMDSAIIASLSGVKQFYTCRYDLGPAYDEYYWAELAARSIRAETTVVSPTAEDLEEYLRAITYYLDYPIATASSLSEFMLAKRASKDVKVVLGGQGADEIFGGYVRYLLMLKSQEPTQEFAPYSDLIQHLREISEAEPFEDRYYFLSNRGVGDAGKALFKTFFQNDRSRIDQMGLCDIVFVLPSLLTMNDRAAAHVGLENRTPFLDYRIVEFAFRIAANQKIRNGKSKFVLREAVKGIIPEEIRNRADKKGLVTPVHIWLNGPLKQWATSISERLEKRGIHWPAPSSRGEFDRHLYSRICLELWLENFFPDFQY